MKKSLLVLALLSTMSSVAWATPLLNTTNNNNQTYNLPTANAGAAALAGATAFRQGGNATVTAPTSNNATLTTGSTVVNTDIKTERSAPAVFAGNIPTTLYSCRLYMFGGGTNTSGGVSGTLPIGNDQTCLSQIMLQMMEKVGGFTQAETQSVACKVEGMDKLDTCKALVKTTAK